MTILADHPHRRRNALTGEWVLVSPHRTKRPWQGQVEKGSAPASVAYDPQCYLCPGNARVGGHQNPQYDSTFVFDNDFAALLPESFPDGSVASGSELLQAAPARGLCRVVCFSPDHSLTVARMSVEALADVVKAWRAQYEELSRIEWIEWVQIFENRGEMMGASNPHPHCQIWATGHLPVEPAKELGPQREYWESHGRTLLSDYLSAELQARERLVCENESFAVVAPFWAVWPFETLLIAKRPLAALDEMNGAEMTALAAILKDITSRYDALFDCSFPYSMGFHQRPSKGAHPYWHFHAHFYPPLLRSATVRKFLVGFEMLAEAQRDITPESAAARLRAL